MTKALHGVIHGKIIELTDDPGLADGQQVEVVVRQTATRAKWGEGIQRSAGALANSWTADDDRILEEIHQDRSRASARELPQ